MYFPTLVLYCESEKQFNINENEKAIFLFANKTLITILKRLYVIHIGPKVNLKVAQSNRPYIVMYGQREAASYNYKV